MSTSRLICYVLQINDILVPNVQRERETGEKVVQMAVAQGKGLATPTFAKRRFEVVRRTATLYANNTGRDSRSSSRARWGGPVPTEFFDPEPDAGLSHTRKAIKREGHFMQFWTDPTDQLQHACMLPVEIGPVNDALMMEHSVTKFANFGQPSIQRFHVLLTTGRIRKGPVSQCVSDPRPGVNPIEKTRPKAKMQFRHHTSGSLRLVFRPQFVANVLNMPLLPIRQPVNRVVPSLGPLALSQRLVNRVPKSDLNDLQGRIERLAQRHVPKIPSQRNGWGDTILPIDVESLRSQRSLDLVKKVRVHACKCPSNCSNILAFTPESLPLPLDGK